MDNNSTALAIDYSKLNSISYDNKAMVDELSAAIDLPEAAYKNNSNYTKQQKIEAIAIFIVVGKLRETSRILNMPYNTLFCWSNSDWWADAINQTQVINKHLVNARTTTVINKTFDNIEKRLDHGDYATYDSKAQEIIFKPVGAKDCATIFGIMYDKQRINNSLATTITATTTHHLIDIKGQFDDMTQAKTIEHSSE